MRIRCFLWGFFLHWTLFDPVFGFIEPSIRLTGALESKRLLQAAQRDSADSSAFTRGLYSVSIRQQNEPILETQSPSAEELLEQIEHTPHTVSRESFHDVFRCELRIPKGADDDQTAHIINELFEKMKHLPDCSPNRVSYELLQQLWLRHHQTTDSQVWLDHLRELWGLYEESLSRDVLPLRSTYFSTFKGLLQCRYQSNLLEKAESLFVDMLQRSKEFPELTPDIQTANHVMYELPSHYKS